MNNPREPVRPFSKDSASGRRVSAELREIKKALGEGKSWLEIREAVGLSRRQLARNLWRLRRDTGVDVSQVWLKFLAKMDARLATLHELFEEELGSAKPSRAVAKDIVATMMKVDAMIVEVGQSLGVYKEAPQKVDITNSDGTLRGFFVPKEDKPADWTDADEAAVRAVLDAPIQILH